MCKEDTIEETITAFIKEIENYWIKDYLEFENIDREILKFEVGEYFFLFDQNKDRDAEDRVVGAFGFSRQTTKSRDTSRMKGFIGGFKKMVGYQQFDKGHFIAHLSGGVLDVNLYPQLTELNRGWSKQGKVFRKMERFCVDNPGTFIFTRPLYSDSSWIPKHIEFGYITKQFKLHVERFENFKSL